MPVGNIHYCEQSAVPHNMAVQLEGYKQTRQKAVIKKKFYFITHLDILSTLTVQSLSHSPLCEIAQYSLYCAVLGYDTVPRIF